MDPCFDLCRFGRLSFFLASLVLIDRYRIPPVSKLAVCRISLPCILTILLLLVDRHTQHIHVFLL